MKTLKTAAAIAALAALTACGGGGGSGTAAMVEDPPPVAEPPPPADPPPASQVRVIDADTVEIEGVRYRLHGIDAPESRQSCRAWGLTWDCGAAATEALRRQAQGMSCTGGDTDRYGRTIGVCSAGGRDLNAWLVAHGWALAYRRFSEDYADEEEEARSTKRGIHRGEFVDPWNWRAGERLAGEDTFAAVASGDLDAGALAERILRGDHPGVWGHWLDHSVFAIVDDSLAVSFGDHPGTSPAGTGPATWTGRLVGLNTQTAERIEGNAVIGIDDLARPDVDVALTGIVDAGGRGHADLRWEDIPLVDGHFEVRDEAGSLEGRFYGADHGEAGGIFERDWLTGAFGASRD